MNLSLLYLFAPACLALSMAPGPSNLLSLSNGTRHGFGPAVLAGGGRVVAFVGMLALASAGLAAVLHASETLFEAIQIGGICYLLFLAIRAWRARPKGGQWTAAPRTRLLGLARNELMLAAGNPKAIVVFTALVPQFIDTSRAAAPQLALAGVLFLGVEWIVIAAYAGAGAWIGQSLSGPGARRLFERMRALPARIPGRKRRCLRRAA